MALADAVNKLSTAISNNHSIDGILDLSKAFDTMDYNKLFKRLHQCGIMGSVLTWFTSNLSNRKQFISYHDNN